MAITRSEALSPGVKRLDEFALGDVEAVRLLLRGASVIDWHRLNFTNQAEVERFLRINEFQPEDDLDMNRLEELRGEAVEYLPAQLSFPIPADVAGPPPPRRLPPMAAAQRPPPDAP